MHQLEHERVLERLHAREILAGLDHDLGDANLLPIGQRLAKEDIGFVAAFLRLKIIRLVEVHRIDLLQVDEILDVDGLGRFKINTLKILFVEDDELPFLVFVALDDLFPRNFLALIFRAPPIIHRAMILGAQETKFELLLPRRGVESDRYVDEAETDTSFPDCTHTKIDSCAEGESRWPR